jgi:hypothetical protein
MNLNIALDSKKGGLELARRAILPVISDCSDTFPRLVDQEKTQHQRNWRWHTRTFMDNGGIARIVYFRRRHSSAADRIQQEEG